MEYIKARANLSPFFIGWIGSFSMILFSFTLYIPFALIGLSLLTYQAYKNKLINLIFLNVISLIGFFSQWVKFF